MLVRIVNGVLKPKDKILLMASRHAPVRSRSACSRQVAAAAGAVTGEVGFVIAGIKELEHAKVGDTITLAGKPAAEPLPGFKEVKPQVFAGLYPVESSEYDQLRDSLEKLKLNDAALMFEPEVSQALGFGFRCGFLGLLHMEIVQERLEREFDMDIITTAPSVVYESNSATGTVVTIESPSRMPEIAKIADIREPIVKVTLFMPQEYVGPVMTLCNNKRGVQLNMSYHGRQVHLTYEIPLAEIVLDFFDKLKSVSRGYASMDYEIRGIPLGRRGQGGPADQRRPCVDALAMIAHRNNARYRAREWFRACAALIPRQMFDVAIQAAIGAEVIARENVKALRRTCWPSAMAAISPRAEVVAGKRRRPARSA